MKVNELINHWQQDSPSDNQPNQHSLKLPVADAARLHALADMYPHRTKSMLISDLISNALLELQAEISQLKQVHKNR